MKTAVRNAFFFLLITSLLIACSTTMSSAPSPIGLVPLTSYTKINEPNSNDTAYHVIQNEETFAANFKASSADAKKPGFTGQMVVAMLTPQPSLLQFEKAETVGTRINVYLRSCTAAATCTSSNFFLATIPKVGNARSVQFFVNNTGRSIVSL